MVLAITIIIIGTHDILNSTVTDTGDRYICLSVMLRNDSKAIGANITFREYDTGLVFIKLVYSNSTEIETCITGLSSGIYTIFVYDLERNLSINEFIPAVILNNYNITDHIVEITETSKVTTVSSFILTTTDVVTTTLSTCECVCVYVLFYVYSYVYDCV